MAHEGLNNLIEVLKGEDSPPWVKVLAQEMESLKKDGNLDHPHVADLIDEMMNDLMVIRQEAMARD